MGLQTAFRGRFLDVLASIYIYNEHRGYTSLDRVLEAVRARCPDDAIFIAAVEKHRADEEKHYRMFKRWFELRGEMPLKVDRTCGHIDHFIESAFGCPIEELDTQAIVADPDAFERLCRVIMITEQRGDVAGRCSAQEQAHPVGQGDEAHLRGRREGRAFALVAL